MPHRDDIHQDAWHWRAHYDDLLPGHETLDEYDPETGAARGFAAIDQSRLVRFELIPQRDGLPVHTLTLLGDARPIFFRRRGLLFMLMDPEQGNEWVPTHSPAITVLGWQRTVGRRNVKSLTFFLEDGTTIVSDDPDAVNWGPDFTPHISTPPPSLPHTPSLPTSSNALPVKETR